MTFFQNRKIGDLLDVEWFGVPVQQTILCGDGLKNSPTNYALPMMPAVWRTSDKLPAKRHSGRADYLFADGGRGKPAIIVLNVLRKTQTDLLQVALATPIALVAVRSLQNGKQYRRENAKDDNDYDGF